MASLFEHFHGISPHASPRPVGSSTLFRRHGEQHSGSDSALSEQVQQLAGELSQQSRALGELVSAASGSAGQLASTASHALGGSVLGGLAQSASSGFSWQSILKDVFPVGGLISGIAGLFSSPAAPAALEQYDAPLPLNFIAVLGRDGTISQAAGNARGQDRAASVGVDLTDGAGGPQPAYTRLANGSLGPVAGTPADRYSGTLDLSSQVRDLVSATAPPPPPATANALPAAVLPPRSPADLVPVNPATASSAGTPGNGATPVPEFDGAWFLDHAPYIAAAVRTAMLDFHPIVDVINDL